VVDLTTTCQLTLLREVLAAEVEEETYTGLMGAPTPEEEVVVVQTTLETATHLREVTAALAL
jgi:hypothetical protein